MWKLGSKGKKLLVQKQINTSLFVWLGINITYVTIRESVFKGINTWFFRTYSVKI